MTEDLEAEESWRRVLRCEQPGGICRMGRAEVVGLEEEEVVARGVPAREAAAEEGLVGETEPPLER